MKVDAQELTIHGATYATRQITGVSSEHMPRKRGVAFWMLLQGGGAVVVAAALVIGGDYSTALVVGLAVVGTVSLGFGVAAERNAKETGRVTIAIGTRNLVVTTGTPEEADSFRDEVKAAMRAAGGGE